jgi:ER membrane protein complex subunit 1
MMGGKIQAHVLELSVALTLAKEAEGLVLYDALIPDDTRWVFSHNYHVLRVQKIPTSPALLEDTAIVFAYRLDLFCGRIAPSGSFDVVSPEFNKAQLVLTIFSLAAGIAVARPVLRRKTLKERWDS